MVDSVVMFLTTLGAAGANDCSIERLRHLRGVQEHFSLPHRTVEARSHPRSLWTSSANCT